MNNYTNYKSGLTSKEVDESRRVYGSNRIIFRKKNTFINLVLESLSDPIIKILLIALGIKILFLFSDSNIYETLGIAVAIFIASFISSISEYGSEKAFEKLLIENDEIDVKVIRNNKKEIVNINDIVVNDIVILESGDKVPADGIIVDKECYINESSLTGESKEKYKTINDLIYRGSIICNKSIIMKVSSVGKNTYYGKIAQNIQEKKGSSPLKEKLGILAKKISLFGYIGALLVFISYMLNAVFIKYNFDFDVILNSKVLLPHIIYALTLSVAVVVMAVPEGLPMMITLVLSSNMKRLVKKNVLVRKLVGIETSGSLNMLFTDKTGTLTVGKLQMVSFISSDLKEINSFDDTNNLEYKEVLYQSFVYNNSSFLVNNIPEGSNSTDRAILDFVHNDNKDKYKILERKEFDSNDKYSYTITNYNNKTMFIKGAYEILLSKCNKYLDSDNKEHILINKDKIKELINIKTNEGNRVLCVAISSGRVDNLTLIGFIILKDNIRDEAYNGIQVIKESGVDVVMVSGDAKETALSIARELNIVSNSNDIVMTSDEFNKLTDEEVIEILPRLKVLCRSMPEDKYRLVNLAISNNLIVGMTGDGVNDAPALKKASVGFAMGSGSELAKETSDIIILDNNIKSIATAILYGRTIYKSIRKFIIFQLSVNVCAVLLSIIGPFIGILSPITVVQVLWVNMVMDTFSGLAFSFEPALIEYMKEKPKNKNESIINKYMINQIILDGLYSMCICLWFLTSPLIKSIYVNDKNLMTAFFGLFVFIDIFNAFNAKSQRINTFAGVLKNKIFLIIFIFISIVQVILIYYGGEIFRTSGLTIYEFEIMLLISSSVIVFDIIRKIFVKKIGLNMHV